MIDYIISEHQKWLAILAVLALVTVVEYLSSRKSGMAGWSERLRNIGAGSALLIVGGYLAFLLTVRLDKLNIFRETELNTLAYVVLFFMFYDFIYYFYHRLQHSWPLLWQIHKLHHTDSDVNITTSYRTHLLEWPIQAILISVPIVLFIGFHPTGFLYITYISMFFLYFGHTKLNIDLGPLSTIFVGPCFHRVHHSVRPEHMNKNFAQYFSLLDLFFGTFEKPQPIGNVETGIAECKSRRDQWLPMIWPLSELSFFSATGVSQAKKVRGRIESR